MPSRITRAADVIRPLLPKRRLTVVDVGHGCNLQPLKVMHELLPGEKRLVAIDRDPDAAELTRSPALNRLPSTTAFARLVEFVSADAAKLPLEKGSVDVLMNVDFWDEYLAARRFTGTRRDALRLKGGDLGALKLIKRDLSPLTAHLAEVRRVLHPDGFFVVARPFVKGELEAEGRVRELLGSHGFDVLHFDGELLVAKPRKG